jgi:predicted nucleotidyltransferase
LLVFDVALYERKIENITKSMVMKLPQVVAVIVEALLSGMRAELGDNLAGAYLRGSLALGDFIPATSDVDVLAVTERPAGDAEFARLAALHARMAALAHPYANRMENAYIDRAALRRFVPGRRHPTLGQGEKLAWTEHRDNWILERWIVRERGVVLFGPDPRTLIDSIPAGELGAAVRARLGDWAEWASQADDPDWLLPRNHKAYVVETMCRALYTLARGELASKPRSVAWALEALPEPWRSTVERSRAWRTDSTPDPSIVPEVMGFVHWAAAQAGDKVTG